MDKKKDNCERCKHKGQYEKEIELGYPSPCTLCKRRATDNFEPEEIKNGECLCIYCKKIIKDGKIFSRGVDEKRGICFDCY